MKRAMTAALAAVTISSMAVGVTSAVASVASGADPQKVCDAIASNPETPKEELAAIRLAQSGKNPELTKALAAMEKAAQKAVKTKKQSPVETDAYFANIERVFEFGYENCTDSQIEGTLGTDGLSGLPTSAAAGSLGIKLTNDTDADVGFGVVRVDDDNAASTDEIVEAIFASEDESPDGVEFVGGGGAPAGKSGFAISDVEAGRYLIVVYGDDEDAGAPAGVGEFTVS